MKLGKRDKADKKRSKPGFVPKRKSIKTVKKESSGSAKNFWDAEYKNQDHFRLSDEVAEDLEKFVRWCIREGGEGAFTDKTRFVDVGCGNGRNSLYLAETFGASGLGYDISSEAISQANKKAKAAGIFDKVNFIVQSLDKPIPLPDGSLDYVLDMMASHVLRQKDRENLRSEVLRVLTPGSYLFLKCFLRDEDSHAKRMIAEHPGGEPNSYIHPLMGIFEHVASETELVEFYSKDFAIDKIIRSFAHRGGAGKRRSIIMYLRKL